MCLGLDLQPSLRAEFTTDHSAGCFQHLQPPTPAAGMCNPSWMAGCLKWGQWGPKTGPEKCIWSVKGAGSAKAASWSSSECRSVKPCSSAMPWPSLTLQALTPTSIPPHNPWWRKIPLVPLSFHHVGKCPEDLNRAVKDVGFHSCFVKKRECTCDSMNIPVRIPSIPLCLSWVRTKGNTKKGVWRDGRHND